MAEINQDTIDGWRDFFGDFDDIYQAVFKQRGIGRDAALIVWTLNMTKNRLDETLDGIAEILREHE
jgi:hypothetical protein